MTTTYFDVHVLQSVPPSNVNRDDTGAPKTAVYGGVRRARVSSQAWKRATREAFKDLVDASKLGSRTQRVIEQIAAEIVTIDDSLANEAEAIAEKVLAAVGIKLDKPKSKSKDPDEAAGTRTESAYLVFFSHLQIVKAAKQAIEDHREGKPKFDKKVYKEILQQDNSLDIALFGRMIADLTDLGVDASAQVAHALSVHAVESEADFYTAVDDYKVDDPDRDAGAGMLGTVEFNSSTLYRYATVNVDQLAENLGDAAAAEEALTAFARGFVLSMPSGKVNSFGNTTVPAAVMYSVRSDRPINFVEAFEDPVIHNDGYVRSAVERLVDYATEIDQVYSPAHGYWTAGVGARAERLDVLALRSSVDSAVEGSVRAALSAHLGQVKEDA
ncbi:CRISPR-associated Cse4 family protein [Brevibacterium sanguinis]|uniref:CRISPR-associated Cse4 family protein n=2 Tax=Brevibacterium TaxID=1696 RepID=A0A366IJ77_9MICO|nr:MULTISPECIES: type I-E CRISPR-associated protein Cas7/Cse4/CasC [Brevibacterium]RBP65567.1 CRISPR-associated Cse4 family protein [Brevibacterium sanguinis]RBP72201.1 CRISPR-associated Cse4 family protein [Brevibacterium celere]